MSKTSRGAAGSAGAVLVDARGVREVDLRAIEALARAALIARRGCGQLRVTNASTELRALLDFVGLTQVIPCA